MMNLQEATMGESEPKKDRGASKFSLSRRQKQYWGSFAVSAILGLAMIWFMISTGLLDKDSKHAFDFTSSLISKTSAVIGAVIFVLFEIIVIILYHKGMDEQEERAILIANTATWYFLIIAIPAWWLLSRASILPPFDGLTVAISSLIINLSVWLWKKFL
jgi:hypothetical protein